MIKALIDKIRECLPSSNISADGNGKMHIVVKNINNSQVYINPLDLKDLEILRNIIINSDNYERLNDIIIQLEEMLKDNEDQTIRHLYTIDEIRCSSIDNQTLFNNDLAFFTDKEIENHLLLVEYIKVRKTALLCGYPATGKTISVVDIAMRLESHGYLVYYYSFKNDDRFSEAWEEILQKRNPNTVFVLDDIQLGLELAADVLLKMFRITELNILFISRDVKYAYDYESLNIYDELKEYTVRTEDPCIDEKVLGIIRNFRSYYQKLNGGEYPVSYNNIVKKFHRNLVVLREYLKLWELMPNVPLESLNEQQLYKNIYDRYFINQHIKNACVKPFLQYICLYYYEISFFVNPKYLKATDELVENNNIISYEGEGKYSIYHSEYSFLLMKAYKAINFTEFNRKYKSWDEFIINEIGEYFKDFFEGNEYPENVLDIIKKISRFKNDTQDGAINNKLILKSIIEYEGNIKWFVNWCNNERDAEEIAIYILEVIKNAPDLIKQFMARCSDIKHIFFNPWALEIYAKIFRVLEGNGQEELKWLDELYSDKMPLMINNSSLYYIGYAAYNIFKIDKKSGEVFFGSINDDLLYEKIRYEYIYIISDAFIRLSAINFNRIKNIYNKITSDVFEDAIKNVKINMIAQAISELMRIDPIKTKILFNQINVDNIKKIITRASYNDSFNALCIFIKVDVAKTRILYGDIDLSQQKNQLKNSNLHKLVNNLIKLAEIDQQKVKEFIVGLTADEINESIKKLSLKEIASAIYKLISIDEDTAKAVYNDMTKENLRRSIKEMKIGEIAKLMFQLHALDLKKTHDFFKETMPDDFKNSIQNSTLIEISNGLSKLKFINQEKTRDIYNALDIDVIKDSAINTHISEILYVLKKLMKIDPIKTKSISNNLNDYIINSFKRLSFNEAADNLIKLYYINQKMSKDIYDSIEINIIKDFVGTANISDVVNALHKMMIIDPIKTEDICSNLTEDINESIKRSSLKDIASNLKRSYHINQQITKNIYSILDIDIIKDLVSTANITNVVNALHKMMIIDLIKTKSICEDLTEDIKELLKRLSLDEIADNLKRLYYIDQEMTEDIYNSIDISFIKDFVNTANINEVGIVLNKLMMINISKTINIYDNIKECINESIKRSDFDEIGKGINKLNNIHKKNTWLIYSEILENDIKDSLRRSTITQITNAINLLIKIDKNKTIEIIDSMGVMFYKRKIIASNVEYKVLISAISIFPNLSKNFAKELYAVLPEQILLNWEELKVGSFNNILEALLNSGYTEEDILLKKLIDYGIKYKGKFIRSREKKDREKYKSLMAACNYE